jgi:hypothetical protein
MKKTTIICSAMGFLLAFLASGIPTAWALDNMTILEATIGPGTKVVDFAVPGSPESVSLKIINGSARGVDRVSSAVVTLNDRKLYTQKDFNQNVSSLVMSLDKELLKAEGNQLKVKVEGRPAAFLKVTIVASYPAVIIAPQPPPPAPLNLVAWYLDNDGDGFGAGTPIMLAAGEPAPGSNWTTQGGDCDDNNPLVYPGNGCR